MKNLKRLPANQFNVQRRYRDRDTRPRHDRSRDRHEADSYRSSHRDRSRERRRSRDRDLTRDYRRRSRDRLDRHGRDDSRLRERRRRDDSRARGNDSKDTRSKKPGHEVCPEPFYTKSMLINYGHLCSYRRSPLLRNKPKRRRRLNALLSWRHGNRNKLPRRSASRKSSTLLAVLEAYWMK